MEGNVCVQCVENPNFRDRSSETSEKNYEATRLRTPETTQNLCPFHRFIAHQADLFRQEIPGYMSKWLDVTF